ncbi:MAG: undecaprenyl-phosphate glucose phosphotransferase [Sphingomonadales bacterium]|nr:undecaprenyl-phosphate glucose phosphotransferase [Sphingomonadales bacterium]
MLRGPRLNYVFRLCLDLALLAATFWGAEQWLLTSSAQLDVSVCSWMIALSGLIWYLCARAFHFYTSITLFTYSQELTIFIRLLLTHLLVQVFLLVLILDDFTIYRGLILLYNALLLVLIPLHKYLYRVIAAYVRNQYKYVRKILVVGSSDLSPTLYRSGILINNLRYQLVGFVGEPPANGLASNYLGTVQQMQDILLAHEIDEVFLALPSHQTEEINVVIDCCEQAQVQVNVINDFNRLGSGALKLTSYAGLPVVGLRYFPLDDTENRIFKRGFDIIFSLGVLLFVLSWLAPLLALLIKLSSRGPVFFRQDRWGINNKKIICYKFRTMVHNGQQGEEPFRQAARQDDRVTPLGRLLRKTSLDELPQFFNVLRGDMSVVGPRPHPIPLSLESKDVVQHYMMRHLVKPGITGWAQVNGSRGEIQSPLQMSRRVAFDLWYIENWSFWLDCQIIFQTIVNLIKGDERAY